MARAAAGGARRSPPHPGRAFGHGGGVRRADQAERGKALAELDLALACARYADDLHAAEPLLVPIKNRARPAPRHARSRLYQARHPLLDPATVVPIDVDLDENTFAVVITGPNTGGKTVTLKTVGLLALMAQIRAAHPGPIRLDAVACSARSTPISATSSPSSSRCRPFRGTSPTSSTSCSRANAHSLVLLDELGAGTDPQEGAALARAILIHLLERRITCLVATHYPELKAFAHATPGVINASMEFDLDTLRPTYHLTIGLPGRSNALPIAERLGLPVGDHRSGARHARPERSAGRGPAGRDPPPARHGPQGALRGRPDAHRVGEAARRAGPAPGKDRRRAPGRAGPARAPRPRRSWPSCTASWTRCAAALRAPASRWRRCTPSRIRSKTCRTRRYCRWNAGRAENAGPRPLRLGDQVRVRSLGMEGVVTALGESEIEVQLGNLRVRARVGDIQRPGEPEETAEPAPAGVRLTRVRARARPG